MFTLLIELLLLASRIFHFFGIIRLGRMSSLWKMARWWRSVSIATTAFVANSVKASAMESRWKSDNIIGYVDNCYRLIKFKLQCVL